VTEPESRDELADRPLSALLSQVLVAFTIELDNAFEAEFPHRTTRGPAAGSATGPWLVSLAMWANFLRLLDPGGAGTPLRELREEAGWVNLAGLQRWGYLRLRPDPDDDRADPPERDRLVALTRAGQRAVAVWAPLPVLIEDRWRARFGTGEIGRLRDALAEVAEPAFAGLPRYLPVAGVHRADLSLLLTRVPAGVPAGGPPPDLSALLARVLLGFAVEAQRDARLALPVSANALRVLTPDGVRLRDLPGRAGVSKEAIAASVKLLASRGAAVVEADPAASRGQVVRLTALGARAQARYREVTGQTERAWREQFGAGLIDELRAGLTEVLTRRDPDGSTLAVGLMPGPDGWRGQAPYRNLTKILVADPANGLPHYPMVSHRGGFPDGS
jgi:DNA-binding MarR family transcriptional regulator